MISVAGAIGDVQNALVMAAPPVAVYGVPRLISVCARYVVCPLEEPAAAIATATTTAASDDVPAPHDAADVDAQCDLDVVCTAGGHRLRVDEFQTAGGVRRPEASSATRSASRPSRSRITCDR